MHSLVEDHERGVLRSQEPPCLSLYQRTHRHTPENQQDPIRFRNLLKSLEDSLRQKYDRRDVELLLEPLRALERDGRFWIFGLDGLAVLRSPTLFRVYRLQRPVPDLAIVADTFHLKPLMRILQSADRYHVLGVSRGEIKLFEGNRDVLDEVEPAAEVPRVLSDVLGETTREPERSAYSAGTRGPAIRHGFGSKQDILDADAERFFRAVDQAVLKHHSSPSRAPLVLAALPENQALFRRISQNPYLLADGIDVFPDALPEGELRERAWRLLEPQYLARLAGFVDRFAEAQAKALGSDSLQRVAEAAVSGRVATLLIEAERHIPGKIDVTSGRVDLGELDHPEVDDVLDDLGELVASKGGEVIVVPAERMPTRTGLAAIYRF